VQPAVEVDAQDSYLRVINPPNNLFWGLPATIPQSHPRAQKPARLACHRPISIAASTADDKLLEMLLFSVDRIEEIAIAVHSQLMEYVTTDGRVSIKGGGRPGLCNVSNGLY
jgi:hypothetical protein